MSMSQTDLREPEMTDWSNYGKSAYIAPVDCIGPDGKPVVFQAVAKEVKEDTEANDDGFLQFTLDPIEVKGWDGGQIRFTRASVKPFTKMGTNGERLPIKGNPNKVGNFLRAVGLQVKPQSNADYRAAMKAAQGKTFPVTLDWVARNKDTGETVRGYQSFPVDPATGKRKSILRAGDTYAVLDKRGNLIETKTVISDVLFANVVVKYFQDATPRLAK